MSLDKIYIIPFKLCLYLRSYITAIFNVIWQSGTNPADWKKACTVLEHTVQMVNVINTARIKQKSLVTSLLDLTKAFGEVHHNL